VAAVGDQTNDVEGVEPLDVLVRGIVVDSWRIGDDWQGAQPT